jgi:putative lipoprotein
LITVALLVAGPGVAGAQSRDRWFAPDKVKHFFLTAFVQSVTYGLARATDQTHQSSMLWASGASLTFGLGKELRDARTSGEFSTRDLVWDAAGAGVASLALRRTR